LLAKERGFRRIILPADDAPDAGVVEGVDVLPAACLTEAIGFVVGQLPVEPVVVDLDAASSASSTYDYDFAEIRSQEHVKQALVIAAAGSYNLVMTGPCARSTVSCSVRTG
jgi:magnesium chelatase family protein